MEFNEIVKDLDNSAKIEELIYNATQEAMDFDPYQFEFYDEENNFVFKDAIETLIKEDEGLNTLPQEQKDLIETLLTKKMEHSIRTSYEAKEAATSGSYNDEYQEYYGGQDGAFGHLYERYLDELNYRKPIEEFYDEYLEEQKTR